MRKVKHWLHILLTILTSGLWLPVYVILLATTEMFNRGYREGKAAGRVARQNEIDEAALAKFSKDHPEIERSMFFGLGDEPKTFSGLSEAIDLNEQRERSRASRLKELTGRARTVGLDQYERAEFNQLRLELGR